MYFRNANMHISKNCKKVYHMTHMVASYWVLTQSEMREGSIAKSALGRNAQFYKPRPPLPAPVATTSFPSQLTLLRGGWRTKDHILFYPVVRLYGKLSDPIQTCEQHTFSHCHQFSHFDICLKTEEDSSPKSKLN